MASPPRAARQVAASLHLPVNTTTTGVRVVQYERQDPLESLVAEALAAAMEEELKTGVRQARASAGSNRSPVENEGVTFQDIMNFSDIYRSNEEYFRKLKELKAAHVETMAKLEKMYQDKLNIKDIRPVVIREESSSVSSRKSLEEKKMLEEERKRILTKQKQRMKELQKLLATRVKAYDSHQGLAQMSKSRVNHLRKSEKARMKEYWQELEERDKKLQTRPLLFERVAQRNARTAAEKRYANTLKALGLSEEFVSEKGRGGKVSEDFTRQELRSHMSDKESSYEEERENEDENYLSDANSQDSCKENTEDVKESREENSED